MSFLSYFERKYYIALKQHTFFAWSGNLGHSVDINPCQPRGATRLHGIYNNANISRAAGESENLLLSLGESLVDQEVVRLHVLHADVGDVVLTLVVERYPRQRPEGTQIKVQNPGTNLLL